MITNLIYILVWALLMGASIWYTKATTTGNLLTQERILLRAPVLAVSIIPPTIVWLIFYGLRVQNNHPGLAIEVLCMGFGIFTAWVLGSMLIQRGAAYGLAGIYGKPKSAAQPRKNDEDES